MFSVLNFWLLYSPQRIRRPLHRDVKGSRCILASCCPANENGVSDPASPDVLRCVVLCCVDEDVCWSGTERKLLRCLEAKWRFRVPH